MEKGRCHWKAAFWRRRSCCLLFLPMRAPVAGWPRMGREAGRKSQGKRKEREEEEEEEEKKMPRRATPMLKAASLSLLVRLPARERQLAVRWRPSLQRLVPSQKSCFSLLLLLC